MSSAPSALDEARARAAAVLMQTYSRQPLLITAGSGSWVTDGDGNRLLDMLAGIGVNVLGHAHPAIAETTAKQAASLMHTSNLYHTLPQIELAERLVATAFAGRVFFCNSGAEANEAAIKLVRKWGRRHRDGAGGIVALHGAFHGRTLGALAATSQPRYREPFEPLPAGFRHVGADLESVRAAIDGSVAALLIEPIQGEGGVVPLPDDLLRQLRALCDAEGLLLVVDEVQSGMGRTGRWWAHQHSGITPDVMTVAKGLGGGMPIGAVLAAPGADVFEPGDHGSTFGGGPLAAATACAVLRTIYEEGLVTRAGRIGDQLAEALLSLRAEGAPVAAVRGRGLMLGVVLERPVAAEVTAAALAAGVLVNAVSDSVIRLLPPLTVTEAEVDEAVTRLGRAFAAVAGGVGA